MRQLIALVALASLAVAPAGALGRRPPDLFPDLPRSEVQVVTATGTHRFKVWIAADDRRRERGLMHVSALPADHGMLFLFERLQFASFWMKDTPLSLDLIFIRADGSVVNVAANATPHSLDPIPSAAPVKAVLELVAGTAARIGLKTGDQVIYPPFAAQ